MENTSAGHEGGESGGGGENVVMRAFCGLECSEDEDMELVPDALRSISPGRARDRGGDRDGSYGNLRDVRPPPGKLVLIWADY